MIKYFCNLCEKEMGAFQSCQYVNPRNKVEFIREICEKCFEYKITIDALHKLRLGKKDCLEYLRNL